MTKTHSVLPYLLAPLALLLVPLIGMRVSDEVRWGPLDFVVAYLLLAGVGLAYHFLTRRSGRLAYRLGAGLALAGALMIVWGNLAVGFIGNEENPANLLYLGVLATGAIGAWLARFAPIGMTYTLLAMAAAQFLVPVFAFIIWRPDFGPGVVRVVALNFCFVLLFIASAMLFRHAARQPAAN